MVESGNEASVYSKLKVSEVHLLPPKLLQLYACAFDILQGG